MQHLLTKKYLLNLTIVSIIPIFIEPFGDMKGFC